MRNPNSILIATLGVCVLLGILALSACKHSPASPNGPDSGQEQILAPDRNLPARDILRIEGITSIHYIFYDSTTYSGNQAPIPIGEYLFDSCHAKIIEYFADNHYWNVTVIDLRNHSTWNYYSGVVTYSQTDDVNASYEQFVQSALGSFLKGQPNYLRTEYLGDKLCDVYTDSTGYTEWVWIQHRLPIQRQANCCQIASLREIELDVRFADSLFEPPK